MGSKAKGAWYGSVKTSEAFRKRLDDEFDYMVTPLVFNLRFHLSSDAYVIDKVFGSPESELSTGQLMRINTLFPSAKDEQGQTKGGVVLLRLLKTSSAAADAEPLKLRVSYEARRGIPDFSELCVQPSFSTASMPGFDAFFENKGVRKAVLLARYASVLKQWLVEEKQSSECAKLACWDQCYCAQDREADALPHRGIFRYSPPQRQQVPEGRAQVSASLKV